MDNFFGFGHHKDDNSGQPNNNQNQAQPQNQPQQMQSSQPQTQGSQPMAPAGQPQSQPTDQNTQAAPEAQNTSGFGDYKTLNDELKELNDQFEHNKRPDDPFMFSEEDHQDGDKPKENQPDGAYKEPELSPIFSEEKPAEQAPATEQKTETPIPAIESVKEEAPPSALEYTPTSEIHLESTEAPESVESAPTTESTEEKPAVLDEIPSVPASTDAGISDESLSEVEEKLIKRQEETTSQIKTLEEKSKKIEDALEKIRNLRNQKLEILKTIDDLS